MKKILVFIILSFTIRSASSQIAGRIGDTLAKIKADFVDCTPPKCETSVFEDGSKCFRIYTQFEGTCYHYFDNADKCNLTIYVPSGDAMKKAIIEFNNKQYVVKSLTEWNSFSKGIVIVINLLYDSKQDNYYFRYREHK